MITLHEFADLDTAVNNLLEEASSFGFRPQYTHFDALILKCYRYNAAARSSTASDWGITKAIMTFLALILIGLIGWMLVRERRRKQALAT